MNTLFNPHRLIEAREARGMKQSMLSAIIGFSTTTLSKWENGHTQPDATALDALAQALGLPSQWFFRPTLTSDSTYFFRSKSTATKTAQEVARIRLRWTAEIRNILDEWVDLPPLNLINSPTREQALQLRKEDIEKYAIELRNHFNLGTKPILNLTKLVESAGIVVVREESGFSSMDGVSTWINNHPYIWVASDKASSVRSRFDVAHELAHIILHKNLLPEDYTALQHKEIEKQAHLFAGFFIAPAAGLSRSLKVITLDTLLSQKKYWGLSVAAMIMQCFNVGLIDEDQQLRLQKNLSFRKWRTQEPFDDTMQPEKPVLMERTIKLLLEQGGFQKEDIVHRLQLSPIDIESLCALSFGYLNNSCDELVQLRRSKIQIVS